MDAQFFVTKKTRRIGMKHTRPRYSIEENIEILSGDDIRCSLVVVDHDTGERFFTADPAVLAEIYLRLSLFL
jgi:hypothetical protein